MPPQHLLAALRRIAPLLALLAFAVGAMAIGIYLSGGRVLPLLRPQKLTVTVLDVGMGEASWIRTPNGKFIVIGGGPPEAGRRVVASLRDAGAERIDLLILPYPYADCIGGAPDLLAAFPVDMALEPGGAEINHHLTEVRRYLVGDRVRVMVAQAGDALQLDGVRIEVLAPHPPGVHEGHAAANNSLVVAARYGETRFLWAGGLEGPGERALLSRMPDLAADWLRLSRGGNGSASSPEFLRLVSPEFAVLSVGPNTEGLPAPETLERLAGTGARVFRTDRLPEGSKGAALTFRSDGTQVTYGL